MEPSTESMEMRPAVHARGRPVRRALALHASGELAIYGTVLVAGLVVIEGGYVHEPAALALAVLQGVAVIWAAHVFAATVAHAAGAGSAREPVRAALGHALAASSGLVLASLVPLGVLWLGALGILPSLLSPAVALVWTAAALSGLGYLALARAGLPRWRRATGATLTAVVGLALVALKVLVH